MLSLKLILKIVSQIRCLHRKYNFHSLIKPLQQNKHKPEVFFKKSRYQKFRKIHRNAPVPESLFNKIAWLRSATLLKRRLWHRCFPVNFAKFLRTLFSQSTSGRLLLPVQSLQAATWFNPCKKQKRSVVTDGFRLQILQLHCIIWASLMVKVPEME